MAQLTKIERSDRWHKYLKYTWEVCRRNEDYREAYEAFKRNLVDRWDFIEKWGILGDPNADFPEIIKDVKIVKPIIPNFSESVSFSTYKADINIRNTINLEINTQAPVWLILSAIEDLFDKLEHNIPENRIQWNVIDNYLKIYDLRKAGNTIEDIAEKISQNRDTNLDTEIKKVKSALERVKKMIFERSIIIEDD
jgi:hypothetical protein